MHSLYPHTHTHTERCESFHSVANFATGQKGKSLSRFNPVVVRSRFRMGKLVFRFSSTGAPAFLSLGRELVRLSQCTGDNRVLCCFFSVQVGKLSGLATHRHRNTHAYRVVGWVILGDKESKFNYTRRFKPGLPQ